VSEDFSIRVVGLRRFVTLCKTAPYIVLLTYLLTYTPYYPSTSESRRHRRNVRLCRRSALGLAVTLTSDLWPWKPFQ